jgi:hypothetical protein
MLWTDMQVMQNIQKCMLARVAFDSKSSDQLVKSNSI